MSFCRRTAICWRGAGAPIYTIFSIVIDWRALQPADLQPVNAALARLAPHRQLAPHAAACVWTWNSDDGGLDRILGPIVLSAAELLASSQLGQVRKCPGCGWLFLDSSRNHGRRWCSMAVCGSKMKSRRQYERKRGRASAAG